VRFTIPSPLLPGRFLDVDAEPGLPAGALRRRLALLTGDARWAAPGALLAVAGRTLDDAHPAGAPPLLPGAHVGPGPAPHDDVAAAERAGAHVAVVTGPGAGRLLALADGERVRVPVPQHADARIEVRRRGRRVRVRAVGVRGSLPAPRRGRGSRRGRAVPAAVPLGTRHRTWAAGAPLRVAGTTLQLRGAQVAHLPRGRPRRRVPPWAWTGAASAVGAVTLAAVLRQPVLLLTAAIGLAGLLGMLGTGTATQDGSPTDRVDPPAPPAAGDPAPQDVAALRRATVQRLGGRTGSVQGDDAPWPADGTLVLVGPRRATLPVARALTLRTLGAGTPTRLVLHAPGTAQWRWTRWWEPSDALPAPDERDVLVVSDGTGTDLGAWRAAAPHARLLLVLPPGASVPAWASTVVPLDDRAAPVEGVGEDVADAQGRAAAALGWLLATREGPGAHVPLRPVALGDLPGVPAPDAVTVAATWRHVAGPRALAAPVGVGADGHGAALDLVRDGPHALVAGTTGAGKSELLTTLVLGLALMHPPRRLAVLLVDFKGGTGLGPLAGLPHVVDHVHDLDVAAARRTLGGLRAEVRRRERLLARAGRTDVADLDPAAAATPPRLLVVVDELRALVDDLPEAPATLARLAAQGRALGMHLVLATQRPAGAVPADLRANVGLRVALRVADEDDSRDVVGTPDAAHLDVTTPGRALVRVGPRPAVPVQVARARHRRGEPPVRLVAPLPARDATATAWRVRRTTPPDDDVAAWVAACRDAARGLPGTGVPWLPALPDRVRAADAGTPTGPDGLLVAIADVPDEQRRTAVRWRPDHGPLLVLGGPRSGRSTALLTAGTHALHAGAHVHAVGLPGPALDHLRAAATHRVGTTVPLDDVHRVLLLVDRLAARHDPAGPADVLLVDGLDALLDALASHARGVGAELLTTLLRRPPDGVHVAAAGPVVPALSRLLGAFGTRLVLPVPDVALDAQAGVPAGLAGPRTVPGRAVACVSDGAYLCQVVLPCDRPVRAPGTAAGTAGGAAAGTAGGTAAGTAPVTAPHAGPGAAHGAAPAPLRIGTLPARSPLPAPTSRPPGAHQDLDRWIPLGVGGDGPGPVAVDRARPLVVAGPPGSGRSSALRTVALAWAAAGRHVLVLTSAARASPGRRPDGDGLTHVGPDDVDAVLDLLDGQDGHDGHGTGRSVLLVDDADQLERTAPQVAERLEGTWRRASGPGPVVALATTTEHAAAGFRGPVAAALRSRQVLVLDPHGPAAADLLGPGAALHVDPWRRPPGRGVLRRDRTLVRVQVHDPGTGARPAAGAA